MSNPPTRDTSKPTGSRASRFLVNRFEALLSSDDLEFETPGFEEIARAVDGELDPSEIALWAQQTASNPRLGERFAALKSFRDEAYPAHAGTLEFRPRQQRTLPFVPWLGWAAAAATVLVTVLLRLGAAPGPPPESMQVAAPAPTAIEESSELFSDGFEGGDPSKWAASSSSG